MAKPDISSVTGNKNTSIDDLASQIDTLKNDLAKLTHSLSDYGVAKTEAAAATARDKATEAQLHAEEFVRTQPATSIGIAAGLGFLIGMMTARR
jgi:ElaB/YqjD/DUF883 family membrane-anchored ribosome-binding protein